MLAEKALVAEEESRLLLQKAAELETEIQRLHITCTKVLHRIHAIMIRYQSRFSEFSVRIRWPKVFLHGKLSKLSIAAVLTFTERENN